MRQTALGASGRRKGDHIVDPRTGEPARGRRAAWVAVPRPQIAGPEARTDGSPRIAPATVADALTTAFLLLGLDDIETLCERSPGVEAWVLPEPDDGRRGAASTSRIATSEPVDSAWLRTASPRLERTRFRRRVLASQRVESG